MKADMMVEDRGELPSLMEPLLITDSARHRGLLTDLALDLAQKSAGFCRSLPPALLGSLADLVRAMNCYYSNLIEGPGIRDVSHGDRRIPAVTRKRQ
jgi:hypothetical protein